MILLAEDGSTLLDVNKVDRVSRGGRRTCTWSQLLSRSVCSLIRVTCPSLLRDSCSDNPRVIPSDGGDRVYFVVPSAQGLLPAAGETAMEP